MPIKVNSSILASKNAFQSNIKIHLAEGVFEFHKFGFHAVDKIVSSNHSVVVCLASLQQLPTHAYPSNLVLHARLDTHGIQNTFETKLKFSEIFVIFRRKSFECFLSPQMACGQFDSNGDDRSWVIFLYYDTKSIFSTVFIRSWFRQIKSITALTTTPSILFVLPFKTTAVKFVVIVIWWCWKTTSPGCRTAWRFKETTMSAAYGYRI